MRFLNSPIVDKNKKWVRMIIICMSMILLVIGGGLTFMAQSQSNGSSFYLKSDECVPIYYVSSNHHTLESYKRCYLSELQNLTEPLRKIGLQFIDPSTYPHKPDVINLASLHIDRISQDIPIPISSKDDVDLILEVVRLAFNLQVGVSWGTSVEDAISEARFGDYLSEGIRYIAQPVREQQLIDLATSHTFDELAELGVFMRPGMLKEFQELGFFLDESS